MSEMKMRFLSGSIVVDADGKTGIAMSNQNQKGEEVYIPKTLNDVIPKKVFEPKGTYQPPPSREESRQPANTGSDEAPYVAPTLGDISRRN
jgi:hypothetical protein